MLSQSLLAALMKQLPTPAFVIGRSGRCLQAFGTLAANGFNPSPDIRSAFHAEKAQWLLTQISHALDSSAPIQIEFSLTQQDWRTGARENSWWQLDLQPLYFNVDGEEAVLCICHDVSRYHQQAQRWAFYGEMDLVSHLYSEKRMSKELAAQFSLYHRHHIPCSLMLFELDYFNQLAEHCGESTRDAVIEQVGKICLNDIRLEDRAFHYQSSSFVVLMPHTQADNAWVVIDRLRKDIHRQLLQLDLPQRCTSISGGLSQFLAQDKRAYDVLNRADQGLANAKALGRNRVCAQQVH